MDHKLATQICSHNRHYAEPSGSAYGAASSYLKELRRDGPTVYYDSVTGLPLFVAPRGRSLEAFLREGADHGWPPLLLHETRCSPGGATSWLAGHALRCRGAGAA